MTGVHHDPGRYREAVASALAGGARFAGLHASAGGTLVRTLLVDPGGRAQLETLASPDRKAATIVDLAPAAGWDEREAHDLYGVGFEGHEPLRPLVDHGGPLTGWTVPVDGHDPYQVAVGPIHAGVIESGHFRFHVVGEKILHLDARLFYKHRGLERAAEGRTLEEAASYVARACAACAASNAVAYALACEDALGLVAGAELARARTILLELERVWSHLNDIAAVCAGTGLAAGTSHFAALTERGRRLNASLTGHRFLFGSVQIGRSELELGAPAVGAAREELRSLRRAAELGWRSLLDNLSFQDRLGDIGVIDAVAARRLGTVGPAARAAGLGDDLRVNSPLLAYDGFEPVCADEPSGDVRSRHEQRLAELRQSLDILEALLERPLEPSAAEPGGAVAPIGIGRVESPRGATSCILERSGERVERVRLRTGSYANWPSVAAAAVGNLLPDFPLINKSFELCYACADR